MSSIRNQVMSGILGAACVLGGTYVAGSEAARAINGEPTVIGTAYDAVKNKIETAQMERQNRIDTENAIKAYGIQAKSYAEAKQKLDSIRFDEACASLGVPVPQKPQKTGDAMKDLNNELIYHNKVSNIQLSTIRKEIKELGSRVEENGSK